MPGLSFPARQELVGVLLELVFDDRRLLMHDLLNAGQQIRQRNILLSTAR